MLPYSALHHLLLAEAGHPLVMTSGNLSDEPIASRNADALQRLGPVADVFLTHDRDIAIRCDDSVVSVIDGHACVLRRSRGFVPRAVRLAQPVARPVLGCGALLKNTFCLASGEHAWLGPHIGDLEHVDTFTAYCDAVARLQRFLEIEPEVVAHDLHPDYQSTRYALGLANVTHVAVQHHHAHVVSAMAEHGIDGAAIGVAYDGTGYGTDGTMWGGEVLCATAASYERIATFRPIPLAGGDRAVREPWRIAVALVVDAFDGDCPSRVRELFGDLPAVRFDAVRRLLQSKDAPPLARGVGRYFDGFGALFLKKTEARFEGQVALEWNQAADPRVARVYRFGIAPGAACPEVDFRLAMKDALNDYFSGEPVGAIAAAFHNTIAEATACIVRRALKQYGELPVVASGGCFQNARLAESVKGALEPECRVHLHAQVPPGDGGIALGQTVVANAITSAGC